jgi:hypothetical protein
MSGTPCLRLSSAPPFCNPVCNHYPTIFSDTGRNHRAPAEVKKALGDTLWQGASGIQSPMPHVQIDCVPLEAAISPRTQY